MKYLVALFLCLPLTGVAEVVHQELQETVRAHVLEVVSEEERDIMGTDTLELVQEVRIEILDGSKEGDVVVFENDVTRLEVGDSIYVNYLQSIDGSEYYVFKDADRRWALAGLGILFASVLIFFTRAHGVRALASLAVSIGAIFFVLVPLLLKGYEPVTVSVLVAGGILAAALFLTHGVHPRSLIAFFGTFGSVVVTGFLALWWVDLATLTGLSSDEAVFLNFSTGGELDFGGLLLGSIVIGILGVLDDVSITQASVVAELKRANRELPFHELYTRSLRVGRDHIGSLVNTLSLAYVGAALPLVLLMAAAESSVTLSLNQEIVAVELIRIGIGSIGLIIAVPLTTMIAAWWYGEHSVDEHGGEAYAQIHHTHGH